MANLKHLALIFLFMFPVAIAETQADKPLWILGITLGLSDGIFNPCALSVLLFLVAYLLSLGSKRKCLVIGSTYVLIVFTVYLLFMYGMLYGLTNIHGIANRLNLLKSIVAILLIIFGAIEIKDFFFYGKGISLEIPKFSKKAIERLVKASTIPAALALGFLVSLVEIPCAGIFPFVYTTLLASSGLDITESIIYLFLYNFFFVAPLLALVFVFYLGIAKVEEAEEKRLKLRRYMRLTAGIIMIVLAIAMLNRWL